MKHVAIYVRVSTNGQSTKSQEPDLRRWEFDWLANHENKVKWYGDKFTGKTMDRPGWTKLMTAVRQGEVSTIVVWKLDRLGRTVTGLTALFDELGSGKLTSYL